MKILNVNKFKKIKPATVWRVSMSLGSVTIEATPLMKTLTELIAGIVPQQAVEEVSKEPLTKSGAIKTWEDHTTLTTEFLDELMKDKFEDYVQCM